MKEIIPRAIAVLQAMIERKCLARSWEQGFYPLDDPAENCRPGQPTLKSPEVQLLIRAGLVSFIGVSTNPNIPESSLRLRDIDQPKAEGLIRAYVAKLDEAGLVALTQ